MVPHVAARKTHQRLLKFSFVTPKRLLQHYLLKADPPSEQRYELTDCPHIFGHWPEKLRSPTTFLRPSLERKDLRSLLHPGFGVRWLPSYAIIADLDLAVSVRLFIEH